MPVCIPQQASGGVIGERGGKNVRAGGGGEKRCLLDMTYELTAAAVTWPRASQPASPARAGEESIRLLVGCPVHMGQHTLDSVDHLNKRD